MPRFISVPLCGSREILPTQARRSGPRRAVRGSLDDSILAKVDVAIADIKSISYMKVQTKIRTAGGVGRS